MCCSMADGWQAMSGRTSSRSTRSSARCERRANGSREALPRQYGSAGSGEKFGNRKPARAGKCGFATFTPTALAEASFSPESGLNWYLKNLVGRMTGSFMDPHDCFGIRRLGQAENLAGLRVGPTVLEFYPFFILYA